ncbi:MAG: hypothetical protein D6717_07215 [Gammaproteobacteria bacterium]|nr:MAG: hypothetical protein D6717_07215 [Gammaproteobacteria bacterium]
MSRRILLRLVVALLILAGIVLATRDFIVQLYLQNQLTSVGWVINGVILALFLLGLLRIAWLLLRYAREESALQRYVAHMEDGSGDPLHGISINTLIARRHEAVMALRARHAPVNHSALAAATVAGESTRLSFPRFVNNVLILLGVLGTIVSLSIALLGASNLVDFSSGALGGDMGLVIHGMSTAMSTTITAIVCYLFYGYFYLKLTDVQTHLLAGLEQATTLYLMPETDDESSIVQRVGELVRSLAEAARQMELAERHHGESAAQLHDIVSRLGSRVEGLDDELREIKGILREGFRLPEGGQG